MAGLIMNTKVVTLKAKFIVLVLYVQQRLRINGDIISSLQN